MGLMQSDGVDVSAELPEALDTADERFHIANLPHFVKVAYQGEVWEAFKARIEEGIAAEVLGSKNVKARLADLEYHAELVNKNWDRLKFSVDRINGLNPTRPISVKSTAQVFYESLNTPMLRKQCQLFNIDYDAYDSQEDIIAVLVAKHMEMVDAA